jgi:hypothetical protein
MDGSEGMRFVFIEWTDACGCAAGWDDRVKLDEYAGNCYTTGIVLDEDELFILVASSVTADLKTQQGGIAIPKEMIKYITDLEIP